VSFLGCRRHFPLAFLGLLLLLHLGCGGSSSSAGNGNTALPSITSVSVSGPADVLAGGCATFTATVAGTGSYDNSVTWYVDGVAGGSTALGFMHLNAYCPPSQPPADNPVPIKAVANGDPTKSGSTTSRVIAVSITPAQAALYLGQTQQFSATESGATNNSILWMVNGTAGGNASVGTISATGLYTAPSQLANVPLSVQAAPSEAPSVYANANLTLSAHVVILPSNPQLSYGATQQFNATVGGTPAQVNWRATYGAITPSGLYTATATQTPDTITAWSTNENGSTTVQVVGLKPAITSISPQPATAGQTVTVTGQNLLQPATAIFSDAIGGQLPVSVSGTDDGSSFTVTVPQGSVTGTFYVQTQNGGLAPQISNALTFQRLARLRIRTPQKDLSAGESATLQYALMGDSTPQTVTFSADLGSFNGATYQAPGTVTSDTFAHVTACVSGTQSCDTLILGLHPFRIAPDPPVVGIGQSLQLSAILGGSSTSASWNLLAGGGSLGPSGLYTAGTLLQDGGPAILSATAHSATEQIQVGVTGAFPGLVNRVYEYFDQHQPNASHTVADGLAVVGNRMYVAASNHAGAYNDSYFWIDIYDVSNPVNPVWLTAIEASSAGPLFPSGQYLYSYQNVDLAVPGFPNTITIYQLQNQIPVLKTRTAIENWYSITDNQGIITLNPLQGASPAGSADIIVYDVTSGIITSQDFSVVLPSDANSFLPDAAIAVGTRLYVSELKNDNSQGYILTYDLTTSPPNLLGSIDGRSLAFYTSGNFLFGALGGMDTYDISAQLPVLQSHVIGINAAQLNGTQLLARTEFLGFSMLDFSNPQNPRQSAIIFDGVVTGYNEMQWAGNYAYVAQADAGIAIFDASQSGGPIFQAELYGGGGFSSEIFDLLLLSPYLYGAASSDVGAVLNVYDTSTTPASRIGQYSDQTQQCSALQSSSSGTSLYLGLTNSLDTFDIANPASPVLANTLSLPVVSLARSSNTLYAGTFDDRLVTLDITNPAQPQILNSITLADVPVRVHVFGNLLLVADATEGLLTYNISAPTSPVLLSKVTGFASANDVTFTGTTAFLAADVDGLAIIDLTNPALPRVISQTLLSSTDPFALAPPNQAVSISLYNGVVYVGTLLDIGLVLGYDYSSPVFPRLVSVSAYGEFLDSNVDTLLFSGNNLFVGGSLVAGDSLQQVDVSQPFDSINYYSPPLALQNPGSLNLASQVSRFRRSRPSTLSGSPRFSMVPPDQIKHRALQPN
jgi:hypothetical protein